MPILLSDSEFQEVRDAIRDVTDTFFQLSISYLQYGESLDRTYSDKTDKALTTHVLNAFVGYESNSADSDKNGTIYYKEGKIVFNNDYLEEQGIVTSGNALFNPEKDYFTIEGRKYRMTYAKKSGQWKATSMLWECGIKLQENDA